jgi:arginase family enzyme
LGGPHQIATAALTELRRVQPNVSLAWIATHIPIRDPADMERYLEALGRAGLE